MVVVLSRFRVANGMEADVAGAFRDRPRTVEATPGFLWLEVYVDRADPAVFYLLTRWTDVESFERWHVSPAHRDSHALIPKGLKLDPSWTQVLRLSRLEDVTGTALTDTIADATLLVSTWAEQNREVHVLALAPDGTIRTCTPDLAARLAPDGSVSGRHLTEYMPEGDAARLRAILAQPRRHSTPVRLNIGAPRAVPVTLDCWLDVQPDRATVIAHAPSRDQQRQQDELFAVTQELAVLSRERERLARAERAAREAAELLNRQRNAFLVVLAHELRQPIGSAIAAMGVLRKMNPDPGLDRPRSVIERQLLQLNRLVEDLADTARVASGEVHLRRTPVDVAAHLRDLAPVWDATAIDQSKRFSSRVPGQPLIVSGDADRLQQVFSNLVGNALKYTPPGGTVTVTARSADADVEVTVEDEGEGIPADRLPRIFDLFERATATGAGLGVGLAVVRALVEAHGGSVTASSPGVGRGSTFVVRLPVLRQPGS